MEIISYVLEGALEHKDSMGTGSVIRPGDVQRMSAGTGVTHSEYNASKTEPVHFLQIWIVPDDAGHRAELRAEDFAADASARGAALVASPDGRDGSVTIHTDVRRSTPGLFDAGRARRARARARPARLGPGRARQGARERQDARGRRRRRALRRGARSRSKASTAARCLVFDLA